MLHIIKFFETGGVGNAKVMGSIIYIKYSPEKKMHKSIRQTHKSIAEK